MRACQNDKTEAPRLGVLFLTLPEVAKITNLGQSTVRKFSKEGKYGFPRSYKLDTLTRWKTDEVLDWIKNFQGEKMTIITRPAHYPERVFFWWLCYD